MLTIANKLVDGARAAVPTLAAAPPAEVRMSVAGDREALVCDAIVALAEAESSELRWRDTAAQRRLELGRALVAARGCWPARGPKAKGWGELLARVELEERTARRYMQLAGYVDEVSDTVSETPGPTASVPTYAEAGIDRRGDRDVTPQYMSPEQAAERPAAAPRPVAGAGLEQPSAITRTADGGDHAQAQDDAPDADRDTWCTPLWIAEAVGTWDVDPCTNERSHVRAKKKLQLERGEDGLAMAQFIAAEKRVWCNPPYSAGQVIQWVRAYKHTRFAFLLRFDSSTEWFRELFAACALILVPRRRVNFEPPPGITNPGVRFPHALFYADLRDATPEIRALCFEWQITKENA